MIIDLICNRKDGLQYDAREFYTNVLEHSVKGHSAAITRAMDFGTNTDVQRALNVYILGNKYNETLCDYVNTVAWI